MAFTLSITTIAAMAGYGLMIFAVVVAKAIMQQMAATAAQKDGLEAIPVSDSIAGD